MRKSYANSAIVEGENLAIESRYAQGRFSQLAELAAGGGESDVDLALQRLAEIRAADPARYWVPSQFDNPDNVEAHYLTTGPEIWQQTGGAVAAFVAAQGTGAL